MLSLRYGSHGSKMKNFAVPVIGWLKAHLRSLRRRYIVIVNFGVCVLNIYVGKSASVPSN
jgi:hypothetical protein